MCLIDYADSRVEAYTAKHRVARKPHVCCECYRVINAGERYLYQTFVQDGTAMSFKTCRHCQVGYDWLMGNCGGHMTGCDSLWREMTEHIEEYPDIAFGLRRIRIGMHRKWQRFDGAGLMPEPPLPRAIAETMEVA